MHYQIKIQEKRNKWEVIVNFALYLHLLPFSAAATHPHDTFTRSAATFPAIISPHSFPHHPGKEYATNCGIFWKLEGQKWNFEQT